MIYTIVFLSLPFAAVYAGDCVGRSDGVFEVGCRSYLTCHNGVGVITNCPNPPNPNTVYNSITKSCDRPSNVPLPCGRLEDCSNMADKRYADLFNHCTTYYTCQGGTFFGHNSCTPGLVFDEVLQTCNWPRDVPPPCGTLQPTTTSVWNNKGGTGKTTLTFHLSTQYAIRHVDKKVLVFDMCPQANISSALLSRMNKHDGGDPGDEVLDEIISGPKIKEKYDRSVCGYLMSQIVKEHIDPKAFLIQPSEYNRHITNNIYRLWTSIFRSTGEETGAGKTT